MTEFIGSRISLISNSEIRYTGILHEINSQDSTIALEQVRLYGTEGRRGGVNEVPPSDNVYDYIVFKGSDVKDLKVEQEAKKPEAQRQALDDPAILSTVPRREQPNQQNSEPPPPPFGMPPPPSYPYYPLPHLYGQQPSFPPPGPPDFHPPPPGYPPQFIPPPLQRSTPSAQFPPTTGGDLIAPSPVQETKPDAAVSTSAPPTQVSGSTSKASAKPVPPALPLPAGSTINRSIPSQINTKPVANVSQQPRVVLESDQSLVMNPTGSKATTTAADVQNLAKNLSETKISTVEPRPVPGAGGYLTQTRRGGGLRLPRRDVGDDSIRHQRQRRTMDADYDFYSATAKFKKEDIAKEVELAAAAASGEASSNDGVHANGDSSHVGVEKLASPGTTAPAVIGAALAAEKEATRYNPGKSFFDNISCESKDRTGNNGGGEGRGVVVWKKGEERKLNIETFGQASVDYVPGRGPFRGGFRGGYRAGRGRGGGGFYPRSSRGGSRGGGKGANGPAASAETVS